MIIVNRVSILSVVLPIGLIVRKIRNVFWRLCGYVGLLITLNQNALELVDYINTDDIASLMYEVADVKTCSNLGLQFAEFVDE